MVTVFFVKSGFEPLLPETVKIGEHVCRTWYASREPVCKRCRMNHKTSATETCPAYRKHQPNVNVFVRGPCSNFARCEMVIDGMTFHSSEQAYQLYACTEHLRDDLAEAVFRARTPWEAKQLAAPAKEGSSTWGEQRYAVMKKVLTAKAKCSRVFREELLKSDDNLWVECSQTDDYWGSGLSYYMTETTHPKHYPGANKLGELLGEIRASLREVLVVDDEPEEATTASTQQPVPAERSRSVASTGSRDRTSSLPPKDVLNKMRNNPMLKKMLKSHGVNKRKRPSVKTLSQKNTSCQLMRMTMTL